MSKIAVCCENMAEYKKLIKDIKESSSFPGKIKDGTVLEHCGNEYYPSNCCRGRCLDYAIVMPGFKNNRDFLRLFRDVFYAIATDMHREVFSGVCHEIFFNIRDIDKRKTDARNYYGMMEIYRKYQSKKIEKEEINEN